MRPPSHPPQQMPAGGALPAVEVRGGAPHLREVRLRACHGADAPDAEDPRARRPVEGAVVATHPACTQNRQCLILHFHDDDE